MNPASDLQLPDRRWRRDCVHGDVSGSRAVQFGASGQAMCRVSPNEIRPLSGIAAEEHPGHL